MLCGMSFAPFDPEFHHSLIFNFAIFGTFLIVREYLDPLAFMSLFTSSFFGSQITKLFSVMQSSLISSIPCKNLWYS